MPHRETVEKIGVELVRAIQNHAPEDRPVTEKTESGIPLTDLQAQLSRLEDAYQVGAMPLDSLIMRSNEIKNKSKKSKIKTEPPNTDNNVANNGFEHLAMQKNALFVSLTGSRRMIQFK